MDNNRRKLSFLGFNPTRSDNADPDEVQLDAEMEKVFAGSEKDKLPFSDRKASAGKLPEVIAYNNALPVVQDGGSDPLVSERAMKKDNLDDDDEEKRQVKFTKPGEEPKSPKEEDEDHRRRKTRSQHYKQRKHSLGDAPGSRKTSTADGTTRKISVQPEDADLQQADIDELTSHRSDDPRGMRRPRVQASTQPSRNNSMLSPNGLEKKAIDHSPHEVFVQLDELVGTGEECEWKETARWIKYEEDVEEGSDRWGRPHVASLSFHSLLNLRRCLETGVVLLDLDEKDLPGVAYRVVEQMVMEDLLEEEDKPTVMRALLLRHRHVNESGGGFHFHRRKFSSYTSLQSLLWDSEHQQHQPPLLHPNAVQFNAGGGGVNVISGTGSTAAGVPRKHSVHGCRTSAMSPPPPASSLPKRSSFSSLLLHPHHQQQQQQPPSHHHNNHHQQHSKAQRRHSTWLNLSGDDKKPKIVPSSEINGHGGETRIDMNQETTYSSSQEDLVKKAQHDSILKRIPVGAEATTVLVGAVDFLTQPTIAFIRLAEGITMPNITEVPIPVRFLFILLGPKNIELDYHEIGRSIATLMSNTHFHEIAYKADDRKDLLSAINEFLDDSIVLPPGNWERQELLPIEELKAKSDRIRNRKAKALLTKNKDKQIIADEEKRLLAAADGGDGGKDGDKGGKKPVGPLEKTGRPWGGLVNDIRRRWPMFKSDIMDGMNSETLAASLFMYFAALSTAITFGGLASDKTFNLIGISETLISACVVGVVFHSLSGQPLTIIGTTGPLLLFDEALYQFCMSNGYSFLTVRVYVGIWMTVIALTVSAFEGSVYVRLFTRFTQEIFSALITLIYLVETAMKLGSIYKRHPLHETYIYKEVEAPALTTAALTSSGNSTEPSLINSLIAEVATVATNLMEAAENSSNIGQRSAEEGLLVPFDNVGKLNQPNTALFCTFLTLGTFALAYYLKIFRNSHFLGRTARRALGDFGVPISIALFVALDYFNPQVYTDKLSVPDGISPSDPEARGWLIPLGPVPIWLPFVCIIPAMLVYILAFMETHISELIVDKPERGLKKGSGLHLDIVLLSLLNTGCGFFGMPWHCAATVRSVTHVSSVTIMSRTHAPGDKPHIVDVKEQRVSGLFVSVMIGLSVAMAPLLRLIPMAVLFGVFLYMGVASMLGVQFFERLRLFLMPVKYHPSEPFVRRVPTWKMHLFTFTQVAALAVLWAVKSSSFSLAFPFFLIMMVPLRQKLGSYFTASELNALDGSKPEVDPENEPDFYEQAGMPQ